VHKGWSPSYFIAVTGDRPAIRSSVSCKVRLLDAPKHSSGLIRRLGLTFDVGSDPEQTVVKKFGVQNPDTQELALHAVYIVDQDGEVFYRKVGRRRPVSEELFDAIDAYNGEYPREEKRAPRPPRSVAWPSNNFQTLLEISSVTQAPAGVDRRALDAVLAQLREGESDESIIAFKALAGGGASREDLQQAAAWLTGQRFIARYPEARKAGADLSRRLRRVQELEDSLENSSDDERGELLQTLGQARGGLARARATVVNNQDTWNLDYAQGMLRSYREVARVMTDPN